MTTATKPTTETKQEEKKPPLFLKKQPQQQDTQTPSRSPDEIEQKVRDAVEGFHLIRTERDALRQRVEVAELEAARANSKLGYTEQQVAMLTSRFEHYMCLNVELMTQINTMATMADDAAAAVVNDVRALQEHAARAVAVAKQGAFRPNGSTSHKMEVMSPEDNERLKNLAAKLGPEDISDDQPSDGE